MYFHCVTHHLKKIRFINVCLHIVTIRKQTVIGVTSSLMRITRWRWIPPSLWPGLSRESSGWSERTSSASSVSASVWHFSWNGHFSPWSVFLFFSAQTDDPENVIPSVVVSVPASCDPLSWRVPALAGPVFVELNLFLETLSSVIHPQYIGWFFRCT